MQGKYVNALVAFAEWAEEAPIGQFCLYTFVLLSLFLIYLHTL